MINLTGDILVPITLLIMFITWILMPLYNLFRTRDYSLDYGNKIVDTYLNLVKEGKLK